MMKLIRYQLKKYSLLSVALYIFLLAVCAKGMYYYVSDHPLKDELISVHGLVSDMRLGGNGKATNIRIKTVKGVHKYSSYYGKVWPGMERIETGDEVNVLAEKTRLNKNEFVEGKSYYIWQLIHKGRVLINYEDVLKLVQEKEARVNKYINYWLVISFFFLIYALLRRDLQIRQT